MNASSLRYLIKEGFRNTWTNRMMSVASICVLMSCLVIIGSAAMVFLNVNSVVDKMEDKNVIMVFVDDKATTDEVNALGEQLKATNNVAFTEFIPKEEAWQDQIDTMDDASAELFKQETDKIPLPDAFKVTVKNLSGFSQTVKDVSAYDNVYKVRDNSELAQKLDKISSAVSVIATVIIAVLFVISLFIIANTIKLTVYSRRLEISIMKSVGATNSFVRLPFVVEGMILGIVSGCISLGAVWGVYQLSITQLDDLFGAVNITPVPFTQYVWQMLGAFIAIGIVSGVGGSLITMRKYLNKEGSEISAI